MQEPEEQLARSIAKEFLLGEIIKVAMRQVRTLSMPFTMLRQAEQQAILDRVTDDIREILKEAIDVIASNARLSFSAEVEQVLFKDGIKATLKMDRGEHAHAIADIAGGFVTVVIEDRSVLLDAACEDMSEPDQPPLFDSPAQELIKRINRGAK